MSYTNCIAIDCEMVGGPAGENMAARVTLVNEHGQVILDKYIRPAKQVIDYRTAVSGITPSALTTAESLSTIKSQVAQVINGRVLVGHSLDADLDALGLTHEKSRRRDLALYEPFRMMNRGNPASLQFLARELLNRNIQDGPHSSVEDAKASMEIYRRVANKWQ